MIQVVHHDHASERLIQAREELHRTQALEESLRAGYENEQAWLIERSNALGHIKSVEHDLETLRESHAAILDRIQHVKTSEEQEPRNILTITTPPEIPTEPATPSLNQCLRVSLLAGLGFGLSVIAIGERRRVRYPALERLKRSLNVPVLGWIGELSPTGGKGFDAISTWAGLDSNETLAFQTLRTRINQIPEQALLAVTSGSKSVGKTTVAANLAVESAHSGKKTLLIDADQNHRGLTELLELTGTRGLSTLLRDEAPLGESARRNIVPMPQPGFDVLPSGPEFENIPHLWEGPRWEDFLRWAGRFYDQIVIDSPAILDGAIATRIIQPATGVLLVLDPERLTKAFVKATAAQLQSAKLPWLGIVANRVSDPPEEHSEAVFDQNMESA